VATAPGQPDLYTITLPSGASLQAYLDPDGPAPTPPTSPSSPRAAANNPSTGPTPPWPPLLGKQQSIDLQLLTASHFAANLNLQAGSTTFTINATPHEGPPITASFTQQIK
jgi:hypothetical protein